MKSLLFLLTSATVVCAQPIDARDNLVFPVNPPRQVFPDGRQAVSPKASGSTSAVVSPEFKIEDVSIQSDPNGSMTFKIKISHSADLVSVMSDLRVMIYIYEKTQAGDIVITDSPVSVDWVSTPIDWKDSKIEEVHLLYPGPQIDSERTYSGCIASIYYKDGLQDSWSTSPALISSFPPQSALTSTFRVPHSTKEEESSTDSPSDIFLGIYKQFQAAESAFKNNDIKIAKELFDEIVVSLQNLQARYPNWQPKVVEYRLNLAKKVLAQIGGN